MASISERRDKNGILTGYKFRTCLGRDEAYRQVFRAITIARPDGLTPAKERKEVERLADEWERKVKSDYERCGSVANKDKLTFAEFVRDHWYQDCVLDGNHTPSSIDFYKYTGDNLIRYFGERKLLKSIDVESIKRYLKWCRTESQTHDGNHFSASTIQHHYKTLRTILEYARRIRYIDRNPCADLTSNETPKLLKRKGL